MRDGSILFENDASGSQKLDTCVDKAVVLNGYFAPEGEKYAVPNVALSKGAQKIL